MARVYAARLLESAPSSEQGRLRPQGRGRG